MADANCLLLLVSFLADASFVELLGYLRTLLLTACGNGVRFHAFACSFLFVPILRPLDYHGILLDCKYWLYLAGGLEATITFHCHDECMLGSALAWLKW